MPRRRIRARHHEAPEPDALLTNRLAIEPESDGESHAAPLNSTAPLSSTHLIQMQRTLGNQSVRRLLSSPPPEKSGGVTVQRYFSKAHDKLNAEKYITDLLKRWKAWNMRKTRIQKAEQLRKEAIEKVDDPEIAADFDRIYKGIFGKTLEEDYASLSPQGNFIPEEDKARLLEKLRAKRDILSEIKAEIEDQGLPFSYESEVIKTIETLLGLDPINPAYLGFLSFYLQSVTPKEEREAIGPEKTYDTDLKAQLLGVSDSFVKFAGVETSGNAGVKDKYVAALDSIVNASAQGSTEFGARATGSGSLTATKKSVNGQFLLSTMIGLMAQGKSDLEIKNTIASLYLSASGSARVGLSGSLSGQFDATLTGIKAQILADAFVGAQLEGSVSARVNNKVVGFEAIGTGKLFAGAQANAGLAAQLGLSGLKAMLSAGAFAGAKAEFGGTGNLLLGGRPVVGVTGKVSFNAGAGGTAHFNVTANRHFFALDFGAGLTIGVGMDSAVAPVLNLGNLKLTAQEFFDYVRNYQAYSQGYMNLGLTNEGKAKNLEQLIFVLDEYIKALAARQEAIAKGSDKVSLLGQY